MKDILFPLVSGRAPLATLSTLCTLLVAGCSTAPTMPPKAWAVAPVLEIQHSSRDADTYYQLGRYHEGQNRLGVAIASYRVAVAADVRHVAAMNALGTALAKSGKTQEAIDALEKAATASPDASDIQNNLGYALMLAGRDGEAVAPLRRAVELDSRNRHAWRNLETAYGRIGERGQALEAEASAEAAQRSVAVSRSPAPQAQPVPTMNDAPQTPSVLVPIAANVFELRGSTLSRAEIASEAATLIKEVVAPIAHAPAAVAYPVASNGGAMPAGASAAPPTLRAPATAAAAGPASRKPALATALVRYEITNGQGGTGLARRLAGLLARDGFERPRLTNHRTFDQLQSYVEYREGYREAAATLTKRLPFPAQLRAAPGDLATSDVRLMLGKDLNMSDACSILRLCARYARGAVPAEQAQSRAFTRARNAIREAPARPPAI